MAGFADTSIRWKKTDDEEEGQALIIPDVFRLLAPGNATLEFGPSTPSTLPSLPLSYRRKPHSLSGASTPFVMNNRDTSSAAKMWKKGTKVLYKEGMQARLEHS